MTKHTLGPTKMFTLAAYTDPPGIQGTYAGNTCGCEIIGNATIPNPLAIRYCPKHAAAPELLSILHVAVEALEDRRLAAPNVIQRAKAAIAKAEEV